MKSQLSIAYVALFFHPAFVGHSMIFFRRIIACLFSLLIVHSIVTRCHADAEKIEKFESIPVRIEDGFQKDSRENYKIVGDVTWNLLEMSLKPNSTLARLERLDAEFEYEVDLWASKIAPDERSVSRINLLLTNHWEIVITMIRGTHKGRTYSQAIITEIDRSDRSAKKPIVTELRRFPPFALPGEIERWSLRYHKGLLELHCNNHKLGTVYSKAFSSWLNAVAFTQVSQDIIVSRLLLSGSSIGYSDQQRALYKRANALRQRAAKAASQGELRQAIELEKRAIPLLEKAFGKNDFSLGLLHQSIARRLEIIKQYAKARIEHERTSSIFKKELGVRHPETLSSDISVAEQLVHQNQLDDAEASMKMALNAFLKVVGIESQLSQAWLTRLVGVLKLQGKAYLGRGEYQIAQKKWQEVVDIYAKTHGADHWNKQDAQLHLDFATRILNSKGQELAKLTRYIQQVEESELLVQEGKNSLAVAKRKDLLPLIRDLFGNLHPETASILIALSIDTFNGGEVDESISMLKEAIKIHREISGEKNPKYIYALGLLGSQLSMLQRYSEATPLLERACDLLAKQGYDRTTEYARTKLELGRHLIRVGLRNDAAKHLTESLQLYRALGEHANTNALKASERLADISRAAGRVDEAERYLDYQRNIVLAAYGNNSVPYIGILTAEAKHLYLRKKNLEAVKKYSDAAALVERFYGKNSRSYEVVIDGMIEVSFALGDISAVVKHFEERLEYELYRRESLFKVYTEREQIDRSVQDLYSLDALLLLALEGHLDPSRAYNHAIAFKGAVVAKQRSIHIAAQDPAMNRLLDELKDIELQFSSLAGKDRTEQENGEYDTISHKRDQIIEQLKKTSVRFGASSKRTDISDLQRVLPDNTVLIDYFEYLQPKSYFDRLFRQRAKIGMVAFVLASDGEVHLVDLGSVAAIHNAWSAWRKAMDAEPYYELKSPELTLAELTDQRGDALRELVWDPLVQYFSKADTVVVSPSLHLVACPFAALPAKKDDSFLVEQFAFATISTPRLLPELLADRNKEKSTKLLLISDIDFDAPTTSTGDEKSLSTATQAHQFFTKLPGADLEFGSIRDSFVDRFKKQDLEELRGQQASEANVRRQIVGSQYVLIDTHGFFLQQDELKKIRGGDVSTNSSTQRSWVSGIALANGNRGLLATDSGPEDGILWADEIAELDLSAVDLVTLSACQTALGELIPGEGMLGAQRAIHIAGARSSLTALWSVESHSTKTLMPKFYEQLWGQQLTKAKSLQQAMISMLREYGREESTAGKSPSRHRTPPALWAGFVLHGDWR